MKGYIYIASAFETVNRSPCGRRGLWVDNDPHFWTSPPTWGICRNDLRAKAEPGDVIFFVLPLRGHHPQMIFGYLTVQKVVTHLGAFHDPLLRSKRMERGKNPNGNIIVNAGGGYNLHDEYVHYYKWEKISRHYAIGDPSRSGFLSAAEIRRKAMTFLPTLGAVLGRVGARAIDMISRKGTRLSEVQVEELLAWLRAA